MARGLFLIFMASLFMPAHASSQTVSEIVQRIQEDSQYQPRSSETLLPIFTTLDVGVSAVGLEPSSSDTVYFPEAAFNGPRRDYGFIHDWYSKHWTALDEPSLFLNGCDTSECIRFTWLRSFHKPVVIRVEFGNADSEHLIYKQSDGAGGYSPGTLEINHTRVLQDAEIEGIRAGIARLTENSEMKRIVLGYDGAQWIIEYRTDNSYTFGDAWSPMQGDIYDLALAMTTLVKRKDAALKPVY